MKKESSKKTVENKNLIDGNKVHRLSGPTELGSSCPFPPGFGPCRGRTHVHHDRIRSEIPNCDGEGVHLSCGVGSSEVGDNDETRYKINEAAFKDVADGDGDSASWSADVLIDGKEQCVVVGPDTNGEGVVDGQASHVNLGEQLGNLEENGQPAELQIVLGFQKVVGVNLSNNNDVINKQNLEAETLGCDENSEEDNSKEVAAAKEVWGKGGISFDSSDEEEVVARLSNRKIAGKKKSKKHRQIRVANCIEGRTLATRLPRSESKSKSK
ncbi:hypothetical protein PIB30_043702 [Stylosanthes scabra]|uniref:Uncharacterized protein n=1 Tax=Stylosanthes scabra TaxID=79078 RepID=A0ABU6TG92_9FABA|nr:hypothetical protein [Stylosanthes scabra]